MTDLQKGKAMVIGLVVFGFLSGLSALSFIENNWVLSFLSIGWGWFSWLLLKVGLKMCENIEKYENENKD